MSPNGAYEIVASIKKQSLMIQRLQSLSTAWADNFCDVWCSRRLQSELMSLMMSGTPGISAFPDDGGNLLAWTGTIVGPDDTPTPA